MANEGMTGLPDLVPRPDPTRLTSEALIQAVSGLREILEGRISGVERNLELIQQQIGERSVVLRTEITRSDELNTKVIDRLRTEIHDDLNKAETNRKESLASAALTIQNGLNKAENTLQIALEKVEQKQNIALDAAEKRVNEKFLGMKELMDKMDGALARFTAERALYITRDQLDVIRQTLIQPLQTSDTRNTARREMSSAIIATLAALGGGLFIYLIEQSTKH